MATAVVTLTLTPQEHRIVQQGLDALAWAQHADKDQHEARERTLALIQVV